MAATIYIRELWSSSGGTSDFNTNYATMKFVTKKTTDASVWSGKYGITKPVSGTNYSFWRSIVMQFYGTFTQVSNIGFYTAGTSLGTGIILYVGDQSLLTSQYWDPQGVEGSTGYDMVGNHPNITSKTNVMAYVPSNPKIIDPTVYTTFGTAKHSILQLAVSSAVSAGEIFIPKLVWVWDEI